MKIQKWAIDKIVPYDKNVKIHDDGQVKKIAASLREFGWTQPIVVDKDGVIIAGHGRRLAAMSLGMTEVPVWVRDDLNEEQVRAARLADNRVAIGNLDTDLMAKELADLDFDLTAFFDAKELDFVQADLGVINEDAFVTDLDAELDKQAQDTRETITAAASKDIPITKALGFKTVKGEDERAIAMFMAQLEDDTGLTGGEAFVQFVKTLTGVK